MKSIKLSRTLGSILCAVTFFSALLPVSMRAGDHTVVTTVEISATAINRYLNTQYNSAGFPRSVEVDYGSGYMLLLTLPQVILTPNNAKLQMIFDVWQDVTHVYHFEIDPSLNVPSNQVTLPQVQAFLTDLVTQLNNVPGVPQWVKDAVTQNYNALGFNVYPSKLIDQINTTSFAQQSVNVVSPYFALEWQAGQGVLDLLVYTYLTSSPPHFSFSAEQTSTGFDSLFVQSNLQATIARAYVYSEDGMTQYYSEGNLSVVCPKAWSVGLYLGDFTMPYKILLKVLLKTDNTWYVAMFSFNPYVSTSIGGDVDSRHITYVTPVDPGMRENW